jgi:uncharacterized repeat protein (TIGR04138 family)
MSRISTLITSALNPKGNLMEEEQFRLLARDPRFSIHAYRFVMHALRLAAIKHYGTVATPSTAQPENQVTEHVTGQQLSYAAAELALQEYGFLAHRVLKEWGIEKTSHIGDIVYHMIEEKHMQRSPEDNRADFDDVFDMKNYLVDQFQFLLEDED